MSHLLLSSMERKNKKVRDLPLSPCDFNLIHSLLIILKDYKSKNLLNLGSYVFSFSPKHHHLFFYHVAFLSRWISCLFVFAVCNKSRAGREGAMGALLPLIRWRHKCSLAFHTQEWMRLLSKLDLLVCWPRPSCYPASCVLILEGHLKIKLRHLLLLLSAVIKSAQCYLSVENVALLAMGVWSCH